MALSNVAPEVKATANLLSAQTVYCNSALKQDATKGAPYNVRVAAKSCLASIVLGRSAAVHSRANWSIVCRFLNNSYRIQTNKTGELLY